MQTVLSLEGYCCKYGYCPKTLSNQSFANLHSILLVFVYCNLHNKFILFCHFIRHHSLGLLFKKFQSVYTFALTASVTSSNSNIWQHFLIVMMPWSFCFIFHPQGRTLGALKHVQSETPGAHECFDDASAVVQTDGREPNTFHSTATASFWLAPALPKVGEKQWWGFYFFIDISGFHHSRQQLYRRRLVFVDR